MRQLFLQKGALVVGKASQPVLDDHLVLVMVYYSFVSSDTKLTAITDVKQSIIFSNVPQKIKKVFESLAINGIAVTKAIIESKLNGEVQGLGYACSGVVIAVGKKVTRVRIGDFVACAGAGYAHHADMVCVPENLVARIKDKKYLHQASVTTVGAIALQGIRRAQLQLGEYVCIIGLGLVGQIAVQLAKRSGCVVIALDMHDDRLELAQALGADLVLRVDRDDVQKEIALYTDQHGVDATLVIPSVYSTTSIQWVMDITRAKGRIGLIGDKGFNIEHSTLRAKEIDFFISSSYGPGFNDAAYEYDGNDYPYEHVRWTENRNMQAFVDLLERGHLDIDSLIPNQIPIEKIEEISLSLKSKKSLGAILSYVRNDDDQPKDQPAVKEPRVTDFIRFIPATKDELRVGFVGASTFARTQLMPIISRIKNVKIRAVVDTNMATSINASRRYGAAQPLVNDKDLFQQDLVDVVVIASPHKFHCDQALRALEKGKAVFIAKPMVTDFEQLDRLMSFMKKHPEVPLCVDYNRSFSSLIQKIKKVTQKRKTPLTIQYRVNAGFIPKENRIQTNGAAGRIIGDACHVFDVFCYLTDSKPLAISVEALHAGNTSLFPTDNVSVQISFADGSICSLLYTALGHKDLGRERMEIFFDSKSIVMEDYDYLAGFGFPKSFDEVLSEPDKGYSVLLNQFFKYVKKEIATPPIDLDRLATVARITLIADRLACNGGGSGEL